jgi:hypothetical protein
MLIAMHGKLGSGKDAAYERLSNLIYDTRRLAFADKLKDSACALLGIDRETMEQLKRNEDVELIWTDGVEQLRAGDSLTMRLFLQRYGTEAHRDIFGDSFWVDQTLPVGMDHSSELIVLTDCRFENEAQRVHELGGEVWQVIGPEDDTGDHPSERPLPDSLIDVVIDNTVRDDDFANLDRELRSALRVSKQGLPIGRPG